MTTNSQLFEFENLKKHIPILGYDEKNSFEQWKCEVKEKLVELLGLPFEKCDSKFTVTEQTELCGYTRIKFTVQTEEGYYVPCYFLVPDVKGKKLPLTICLSGHGGGMHVAAGIAKNEKDEEALNEWHHRAMGLRAVKDGRCALVVEARNFGESSVNGYGVSCTEAAKISLLMGRTVIGERVWDVMRILDAVTENFDFVDMSDVVCTGNSGGGTAAYYVSALDERITACAPSCSVCNYEDSIAAMPHCICNHVPSIRKYFEMGDLACLIAPRKLVIGAGRTDDIFPIEGTKKAFEKIERIYDKAGAKNNCALVIGDGGHLNYADLIWEKLHEMGV